MGFLGASPVGALELKRHVYKNHLIGKQLVGDDSMTTVDCRLNGTGKIIGILKVEGI